MTNKNSSSGVAEDLIRAYIQFGCAELHIKTLIEKYLSKGKKKDLELVNTLNEQLNSYAELRRDIMRKLLDMFKSNEDAWCLVKHGGVGAMQVFEAFQNSDDDTDIYYLWIKSNKHLITSLSIFLGTEIVDCASCFSEILKGDKKNA